MKQEIRKRLELFFSLSLFALVSLFAPDKVLDALREITKEAEEVEAEAK